MFDLVRHSNPSLGLSTFEEFDRLLDNFWKTSGLPTTNFSLPSVDIYSEDNKHMVVEMQAPGFDDKDLTINVRDGVLEIRGEHSAREEDGDKKRTYLMRESHASFARRVVLPEGADADNITAELEKGVLRVTVPVERPEAKRVEIKSRSRKEPKKLEATKK